MKNTYFHSFHSMNNGCHHAVCVNIGRDVNRQRAQVYVELNPGQTLEEATLNNIHVIRNLKTGRKFQRSPMTPNYKKFAEAALAYFHSGAYRTMAHQLPTT